MAMDSPEGNLEPTEVLQQQQQNVASDSLTEDNLSSDLASSSRVIEEMDKSNLHLMIQTETLLARMEDIKASTSGTGVSSHRRRARDPDAPSPSKKADPRTEVNTMLGKAEKLASMMISPLDNSDQGLNELVELSSSNNVDPLLGNIHEVRKKAVARALRQNRVSGAAVLTELEKNDSPEKTEPTSDEMSSRAPSLDKRDPPGKSSKKTSNLDPPDTISKFNRLESSDLSLGSQLERPASTVHLEITDDDVSSVGSPSLPVPVAKDMGASMRSVSEMNAALDAMIMPENEEQDKYIPNSVPPFVDPVSADGGIQWEKVTTARSGEDDYAPLLDYTNMKPEVAPDVSVPLKQTTRARLSLKKRRRSQAKLLAWGIVLAILVWFFLPFSDVEEIEEIEEIVEEEVEVIVEEEPEPLVISFDAGDSCFEGMEVNTATFLMEVLRPPEVIEEEVEEPRGFLGIFRIFGN